MKKYPAIIDGELGAYGVVIPDMPGVCGAMGATVDEVLVHAEEALSEFVEMLEADGKTPCLRPAIRQHLSWSPEK